MLEDYRAGLSVDREADRADRLAGRTIGCPTLVLWSRRGDIEMLFDDPLALWKAWTDDLRGTCVESGAQIPEDNPDELVMALTEFLSNAPQVAARREPQA
jgi:haloacetate dehalogenase